MSGLRRIVHEIHRRSLWQVLGLYVVTSWVVIQVVDVLAGHLGLPEWVPPFAFILLLIGLPVVLATAFVQEGISPPTSRREPERIRAGIAGEGDGSGKVERATDSTSPSARHAVLTWRNAILGGVGAFALLGVLAVGYMALRALGIGPAGTLVAKGILEERERIIVAEFASASGDSSLATAVAQALRVDLSQSPTVVLVGQDRVASVLERMGHHPGERLEAGLAREVALRDGIKAVVTGQVDAAGSGYVLTVQLVVAADGQVLASAREAAADDDALIGAIDALSERLRERVGESVRSIRASPALERVTTSSLEALRSYSQAEHAHLLLGETDRAVSLLERAVALDTAFAMAWRKLGVLFGNRGERRSQSLTAFETALRHGERLPERERFLTLGTYYQVATGERDRALTAYENVLEIQPDDPSALHNLGGIYASLRDHARAIELYERAYAIDSVALTLSNVSIELANLGRWDESDEVRRQLEERFPENPDGPLRAALLSAARQRWDSAAAHYAVLEREHAGSVYWVSRASFGHAGLDAVRGRLADAEAHLRAARSAEEARELPAAALRAAVAVALLRLAVTRDTTRGIAALELALDRYPLAALDPLDRPHLDIAGAWALAGRADRAREAFASFERDVPSLVQHGFYPEDHFHIRGEIALAEGRYEDAVEAFRRADAGYCTTCALPRLARALEGAGDRRAAIEAYERYLDTDYWWRLGALGFPFRWPAGDWLFLAPTYERLARLYEEEGDLDRAALYHGRLVELWADADAELQPRVRSARARIEEIERSRG